MPIDPHVTLSTRDKIGNLATATEQAATLLRREGRQKSADDLLNAVRYLERAQANHRFVEPR